MGKVIKFPKEADLRCLAGAGSEEEVIDYLFETLQERLTLYWESMQDPEGELTQAQMRVTEGHWWWLHYHEEI